MLVRFKDDPDLLHGRVVLLCRHGNLVKVLTPDRDINETVLEVGETYTEIRHMDGNKLPSGVRERDTYLAKHSDRGEFTHAELLQYTQAAAASGFTGGNISRRLDAKSPAVAHAAIAPAPTQANEQQGDPGLDDGRIWITVYSSTGKGLGDEIAVPPDVKVVAIGSKPYALFNMAGVDYLARKVVAEEVTNLSHLFRMGENLEESRDLRILPVMFDAGEERWRNLADAIGEYEEVDFDDFPLQGPRTVYRDVRQLRRQGMDFIQHHESWLKKSGVRSSDRSVYEHACICRTLNYMASYDQLNIPSLASAESLNRRRALIEIAHQGRPDAPSYEGAEEILGVRESTDGSVIDPAITQHAARRQAAKAEIMKQKRLMSEETRYQRRRGEDGEEDGKGKGRGRGRGKTTPASDP